MSNVSLKFPSTHILWLFRRTISLVWLQVNPALRTLTCACNAENIHVAISSFGAEIVEPKSLLTETTLDNGYNVGHACLAALKTSNNSLLLFADKNLKD